jgi:hypothetical protein
MARYIVLESDQKELGFATVKWTIKNFAKGISIGQRIFKTPSFAIETPGDPILQVRKFHFVLETYERFAKPWVRTVL